MSRFACIALAMIATACARTEYGPVLSEPGSIAQVCYVPAGHGSGSGISSGGHAVFTSTRIPARYSVVFNCQHGNFAVEGQDVWVGAVEGSRGTIYYREVFEVDGDRRTLVDLDFVRFEGGAQ